MSVSCFKDLMDHVGHKIVVAYYGTSRKAAVNVAVECETCKEVLQDFERPAARRKGGSKKDPKKPTPEEMYPLEDWQYDVANGDTKLGYGHWIVHNVESHKGETNG